LHKGIVVWQVLALMLYNSKCNSKLKPEDNESKYFQNLHLVVGQNKY